MSLTEKIFQRKLGRVPSPGEVVEVVPDIVGFHDLTGHHVVEVLEKMGGDMRFNPESIVVSFDHLAPPPDKKAAEVQVYTRGFVRKVSIRNFYDVGSVDWGILHQVILEKYALPGQIVFGADSHTNTAGAVGAFAQGLGATDIAALLKLGRTWLVVPSPMRMRILGNPPPTITGKDVALDILGHFGVDGLNGYSVEAYVESPTFDVEHRATVSNMSTEMGADAFMFVPDRATYDYVKLMRGVDAPRVEPEPNAKYVDEYDIELPRLEPLVAAPYTPDNVKAVTEVEGTEVDMVFIGSCTNGRLSDLEAAARIVKGRRARARCIVIPASHRVFQEALRLGYVETFTSAGCVVTYGTCGPCLGGHFGIPGPGEVVVSTSNRNFRGRMGHVDAKIYLSNPYVAAASIVEGKIVDPRHLL